MSCRPAITELGLSAGKKGRLHRILHQSGLRNGTALLLSYGLGLDREPQVAGDPTEVIRLAFEGDFNGIVLPIELAEKFYGDYAGELPLIPMLNGHPGAPGYPALNGTVADAVRLGADAVGYTLHVDSPARDAGFRQCREVQEDAERYGMPLFVWAYPRGTAAIGGGDSPRAIDEVASTARALGADVAVVNFPRAQEAAISSPDTIGAVVGSAGRALLLVSSGAGVSDEVMLEEARLSMAAGVTGLVVGLDVAQRDRSEWLPLITQLKRILGTYCD